jgi:type I restriction enzyme S subunit
MQQLLTGKKRLPGFSGEWKEVKLGDVFDERNETNRDDLPLLSITGDKGVIYQSDSDKRDISNDDKSKYKRICPNDIGYNTMRMWQGRSALSELEGIVSPAYTIVTPREKVNVRFMAMLIQQPRVVYDFWTHSQGLVSDTLNCKYPDFCQVKVRIPTKEEQTAIASVLVKADKEIELAKEKLSNLQSQKRGLMQQLLTGRKRIIG